MAAACHPWLCAARPRHRQAARPDPPSGARDEGCLHGQSPWRLPDDPMNTMAKVKTWPLSEVFGPTIQGEGPDAGRPCYFIRLGGCDYQHCSWCDTLFAVLPEEVRKLGRKSAEEIVGQLSALQDGPDLVVLSGGNPAMHDLTDLVHELHAHHFKIACETQGSRWQKWLTEIDRLVISPKPPSSGMQSTDHDAQTRNFMQKVEGWCFPSPYEQTWAALKIVIF